MKQMQHDQDMSDAISSDSETQDQAKEICLDFLGCFKNHLEKKR